VNDINNKSTSLFVSSSQDITRLEALRRYNILDGQPDLALDKITELAALLLGVPVALVDLVEADRILAISHFGTETADYPLVPGFCASAIVNGDAAPYVVNDAKADARTASHPLVEGEAGIRFYAGVPLRTYDGHNIGTLCVIDFKPREITAEQLDLLQMLAVIVMELIELGAKARRANEVTEIENKFKLTELQNQLILNSTAEGIHVINLDGIVIVENEAAIKLLGWEQGGLLGKFAHTTLHHHHADNSEYPVSDCPIYKTLADGVSRQVSHEVFWRKDGTSFPVEYSTSPLKDLDGNLCGTTVVFRDITNRRANEARIQNLAYYDALTNLPNRTLFVDRLEQEIKKAQRHELRIALMFIDLDRFKEINDTLGHDVGDQLLVEAATRLNSCIRQSDTVARLGGDEFTVVLNEINELGVEEKIAQGVLDVLAQPFILNNETIYLSASIGITIYPDDGITTEKLLKNADQAMYAAKKMGRNRYQYFTKSMQESATSRLHLITDLHNGLRNKEFFLVYQPIIDLMTGSVKKAEALIRWQHPTKGLISPVEFIPVAEDIGLIVDIGQWVFEQAAQTVKHLEQLNIKDFQISVNKSPVQFTANSEAHGDWFDYLSSIGLSGENICVEITEGLLMDTSKNLKEKLLAFRDAGVQVSLDDFGTGYSSLSYLNKFSIDYIKIDRSFINNLSLNKDNYALCEAIIAMAHKLNIKVIAEGIETEYQYNFLKSNGCDYGQGYYFAKPLLEKDFETYLLEKHKVSI
jgi:diguanylate cyclase (GGDEF)-like protein/PAS domain S-box-containing protein